MSYVQKEGQGSLFVNDKREKDSHPNLKGSITIGGVEYWLSAWTKQGERGKWISLSAQPKEQRPQQNKRREPEPMDMDDDIPF